MSFWSLFRLCNRWRYLKYILLAFLILLCGGILYTVNPTGSDFYMDCPFYYLTGYHCPGCGSLRGMHQLLHGDIAAAFSLNPLFVILIPVLGGIYVFKRKWLQKTQVPIIVLCIIFTYWILRNMPFLPFSLLAPH